MLDGRSRRCRAIAARGTAGAVGSPGNRNPRDTAADKTPAPPAQSERGKGRGRHMTRPIRLQIGCLGRSRPICPFGQIEVPNCRTSESHAGTTLALLAKTAREEGEPMEELLGIALVVLMFAIVERR